MAREPTRANDEEILTWVKLRTQGMTSGEIAKRYDVQEEWVRVATNRVLKDDSRYSGPQVVGEYWNRIGGRRKEK
jgi:transposase